jgi:hypothetical protein
MIPSAAELTQISGLKGEQVSALEIELVGELAGLLSLVQKETASKHYASGRSVTLVAGA